MMQFHVSCPHCGQPVYGTKNVVTLMVTEVPLVLKLVETCQHCKRGIKFTPYSEHTNMFPPNCIWQFDKGD